MSKANYGTGNVFIRGKRWWIAYHVNGQLFRESSKSEDRAKAVKLLKQRLSESHGGPVSAAAKKVTVAELLALVERDYSINKRKSHWWAKMLIEKHLVPAFGYVKAERLGSDHIRAYIEKRTALKRSNATINHELALLRRAFKLGFEHEPSLVQRVPKIKKLREDNVRTGFFEDDQYETLLKHLPDELKPLLTFAVFTGCRRSELLKMQWEQVDLESALVRLNPGETKNDQGRTIPLADEVLDALRKAKADRDENWPNCPWVFSRNGQQIRSFKNAWVKATTAAGMPGMLFHDSRRSGVRNLIKAGVPERVAMAISGHKTRSIFDRYAIVSEADLHEAAKKLSAKRGKKK